MKATVKRTMLAMAIATASTAAAANGWDNQNANANINHNHTVSETRNDTHNHTDNDGVSQESLLDLGRELLVALSTAQLRARERRPELWARYAAANPIAASRAPLAGHPDAA